MSFRAGTDEQAQLIGIRVGWEALSTTHSQREESAPGEVQADGTAGWAIFSDSPPGTSPGGKASAALSSSSGSSAAREEAEDTGCFESLQRWT